MNSESCTLYFIKSSPSSPGGVQFKLYTALIKSSPCSPVGVKFKLYAVLY